MAIRTGTIAALFLGLGIFGANAQTSTADQPVQREGGAQRAPKTTGAMEKSVGGTATSAEDAKRQTEGKPTVAQEGKGEGKAEGTHPGMTQHSPGTVGASPGTNAPRGHDRK